MTTANTLLARVLRENVKTFKAYSSARDEFSGEANIFLDANENALGSPITPVLNRYPDPYQRKLRRKIAELLEVSPENIVLGNGSDELIDLLIRATIAPNEDQIWITEPSYGMYEVSAALQEAVVKKISLNEDFDIADTLLATEFTERAKLLFLCSPNNPSGNLLSQKKIETLLVRFPGLVVIDEAYIDFSDVKGWIPRLEDFSNLVVLRTLSKSWGMAGARLGIGVMTKELRAVLDAIKPPYNLNSLSAEAALSALQQTSWQKECLRILTHERERLVMDLKNLQFVEKIYPSVANFILIKVKDADALYGSLLRKGIIVRNRNSVPGCKNCLRITIGSPEENTALLNAMKSF